jgi:GTP-binding protein EngB required for normal cell division
MALALRNPIRDPLLETYEPLLGRLHRICNQFQIVFLNRQIEACKHLLHQDKLIHIAVLGQFKAGESSFLNSLIGKPLPPVGVIPVTTTITRLQCGKRERAIIRFF